MSKVRKIVQDFKKNPGKSKLLLWGMGLLGALLLILPGSCQKDSPGAVVTNLPQDRDYQQQLQRELEGILSRIEGAGQVTVMLTLEDDAETVYASNQEASRRDTREEDSQGGVRQQQEHDSREQLVIVQAGNEQQPVAVKKIRPRIRGVLVVASGVDNPIIKERLTQAVQGVLDMPAYKITVQKGR